MLIQLNKPAINLEVDFKPKKYLIVCSHERSGTHFLMNSISLNSDYTVDSHLTFDHPALGDIVNFYFPENISLFFDYLDKTTLENKRAYLSSIIKSHHSHHFFRKQFPDERFIFIYIYRNPMDTLLSFWKFILRWEWDEGTKAGNPYEFVKSAPEGYLMRYQHKTVENYFTRWAEHQLGWFEAADNYNNILCVSYHGLKDDYTNEVGRILEFMGINAVNVFRKPPKNAYVKGTEQKLDSVQLNQFRDFVVEALTRFPRLEKLYENQMGKFGSI